MFYVYFGKVAALTKSENEVGCSIEMSVLAWEFVFVDSVIHRFPCRLTQVEQQAARPIGLRGCSNRGYMAVWKGWIWERTSSVTPFYLFGDGFGYFLRVVSSRFVVLEGCLIHDTSKTKVETKRETF